MLSYDPFSEEVMRDPYPTYRRLRAESPVHYLEKYDAWALARFEDIWNASMDDAHLTALRGHSSQYLLTKTIPALPNLNHMDPPAHTRLRAGRRPVLHAQARALARAAHPRLRHRLHRRLRGARLADVVTELAQIVAVRVACLAVGFPEGDSRYIVDLVKRFMSREEGVTGMTQVGVAAFAEMQGYLTGLARAKRGWTGAPRDPIDVFLAAAVEGEPLEDD